MATSCTAEEIAGGRTPSGRAAAAYHRAMVLKRRCAELNRASRVLIDHSHAALCRRGRPPTARPDWLPSLRLAARPSGRPEASLGLVDEHVLKRIAARLDEVRRTMGRTESESAYARVLMILARSSGAFH